MTSEICLRSGNAFRLIQELPNDSVHLTVTSPPYNIGKDYEHRRGLADYLKEYTGLAHNLFEKTSSRGSVCWQVGSYIESGEVYPLDIFFYKIFKDAGFKLRNRIIWHYGHGLHAQRRLSGRYETILWFTKGDDYTFDLDAIRVPAKYPGKRAFKGPKKGELTGNPLGKNPSDLWRVVAEDWKSEVWDIPNVKANHPEKTNHPCQFPIELVQRCILALTGEGELVLDPFLGVGSTAIGAILHSRRFVGFELDGDYLATAKRRIEDLHAGVLKIRPLGRPVYEPTGRESVARIPDEWL